MPVTVVVGVALLAPLSATLVTLAGDLRFAV
jgi:hypothetical protein